MEDLFLLLPWLAGLGVAAVTGPLGCFVVWRRMAYFGDTMAHSALLGVALGLFLGAPPVAGVVVVCSAIALALVGLQHHPRFSGDTLLGILSHSALSLGLLALAFMPWVRTDLMGYLFGDLLAVSLEEVIWIYGGGVVVLVVLSRIWNPLLAMTLHEDLARAEGIAVKRIRLLFMLLIALVIAVAMKLTGILLVTSLLIIPPAGARHFARSPEQMAVLSVLFGTLSVTMGLWASLHLDTPSGPSIVIAAMLLFLGGFFWRGRKVGVIRL
ncbi:MAG: zinc ABC transporter permease subunit ZnuB [Magnetococcales bacterium]|nr:zinc ABC transporter permease subunit ZnuB [Magnetococcales bacterium]